MTDDRRRYQRQTERSYERRADRMDGYAEYGGRTQRRTRSMQDSRDASQRSSYGRRSADGRYGRSGRSGESYDGASAPQSRGRSESAPAGKNASSSRSRRAASAPTPAYKRTISQWRRYGVTACTVIMLVGCVLGWAFFLRPTASAFEKRDLTPWPAFTTERFLDGTFFSDLSLWYADTFPFRDTLVQADAAVDNLFGVKPQTQMIGGNVVADELPPIDGNTPAGTGTGEDGEGTSPAVEEEPREPAEKPDERVLQEDIQGNIMNGLYVDGDAAYSVYYFLDEAVQDYCAAVNRCAERLDGVANVYSVLVPNNSGAKLDEDVLEQLGGSDQRQALEYFYSLMSDKVKVVKTLDALRAHRDEYTYFRTDHHWTQLGAYYAYEQFCKAKGIEPSDITKWEQHDYEPMLGSFYQELWLDSMAANPDTLHAYVPSGTNEMTAWDEYGNEYEYPVVADATDYDANAKYMAFIAGDQMLSHIENPMVTDGSSCLVVKDSYGCAFVPNLVDNYQDIWVIDFRKFNEDIPSFVYEKGIKDVIFLNNMTIAGTDTAAAALRSLMG